MNLVEVTELINAIPSDEIEMRELYIRERAKLVEEINKDVVALGQREMTLNDMLLLSPRPDLAE